MRIKLIVAASALVLVAAVTAALVSVASGGESQLGANKVVARRDAQALVRLLRLPAGTTRTSSRPTNRDSSQLASPSAPSSVGDSAHGWWRSDEAPQSVVNFIRRHPPFGAKLQSQGSAGNVRNGGTSELTLMYSWPSLGEAAYNRSLSISVLYLPHGRAGIIATSQSYWILPRPAHERVPSSVRVVDVTLRLGHGPLGNEHPVTTTHALTRATTVRTVVANINALTTVQPGLVYNCPAMIDEPGRPLLTLVFRAGPAGPALARAEVEVIPGHKGYAGWTPCSPIQFWVGGKAQKPLISRTFVAQIARLIGADIS